MKIIKDITMYICNHCNKKYLRKQACIKHEARCNKNPVNKRPCLESCKHLGQKNVSHEEGFSIASATTFYCKLSKKTMYHPICEYKPSLSEFVELTEQEPMPKKCSDYKENNNE